MYYLLVDISANHQNIKDYSKSIGDDKSIFIVCSEAANLNPREETEVNKSIEEGVQSRGGGVIK